MTSQLVTCTKHFSAMDQEQSQEQSQDQTPPLLTLDGRSYNMLEAPDSIKILIDDLMRIAREVNELQFKLRQAQLSQQAYIATIEKEIKDNNIEPYRVEESNDHQD